MVARSGHVTSRTPVVGADAMAAEIAPAAVVATEADETETDLRSVGAVGFG